MRKKSTAGLLALGMAVLFTACQGSATGTAKDSATKDSTAAGSAAETAKTETESAEATEAKAEGEITLYTSQPEEDAQAIIEAFNKKYPDIKVSVFRSGTEEVISKLQVEKQAGSVLADVLLVSDSATFEALKSQDMLLSYESPELAAIAEEYYDADHTYTGTKLITTGIVYNTDKITSAPASYKDLLKEEYKEQLIMPSPLYSGAAAYNLSVLTRTEGLGWEFYEGLKSNSVMVGKGNGSVQEAVSTGDKGLGIIVDYMALRAKAEGAPMDFVYPEEGSLSVTEPIGIMKDSGNAEAARTFVDYILSEEGQKVTAEIGYTPIRGGVAAPEGFKSADEIKNLGFAIETIVSERDNDKARFAEIFGGN